MPIDTPTQRSQSFDAANQRHYDYRRPCGGQPVHLQFGFRRQVPTYLPHFYHCLGTAITFSAYLLHRGRVIESSEASSFFNTPQTDEAKKFIAGELLI